MIEDPKMREFLKQLRELWGIECEKLGQKGVFPDGDWRELNEENYAYSTTNLDWLGILYSYPCCNVFNFYVKVISTNYGDFIDLESALSAMKKRSKKGINQHPFSDYRKECWLCIPYNNAEFWSVLQEYLDRDFPCDIQIKKTTLIKRPKRKNKQ